MKRQIKFRAWDKHKEEWVGISRHFDFDYDGAIYQITIKRYDFILMQYTGLKDRNGKEIAESDILTGYGMHVVKVHCGCFVTCPIENLGTFEPDYYRDFISWVESGDFRKWEVIGNIYENPELLK